MVPRATAPSTLLAVALSACAVPPARPASAAQLAPLEVAVTVDDLPFHGPDYAGIDRVALADHLLATFHAHHVPEVYGFVNGKKVDEHPEAVTVLRHWLAAGYPLGNHTYSHASLNELAPAEYLADLEKGEAVLRALETDEKAWRVFRYPYLFEGDTLDTYDAVSGYLRGHGYVTAEVTIDGDDWAWNPPFARCKDRHDTAALAELRRGYVETHVTELGYVRGMTRLLAGRDVKHVLLLHVGAADADAMDELLTAFEREGVRWVDLRTALADPFYASSDRRLAYRPGAALPYPLARVAKTRGVTFPPSPPRPAEDLLDTTCR